MQDIIYLDNSATTRPSQQVIDTVHTAMTQEWFNPSALYKPSMEAQKHIGQVRKDILHAAGADKARLIFTSCGTEADNLAILGHLRSRKSKGRVLVFAGEHPAVRECMPEIQKMGYATEEILPGKDGVVDLERLRDQLADDVQMLIVMQVNNESGAIQPLDEICSLRNQYCPDAAVHVDGVQGFLRVPVHFDHLHIQSYALSGHKVHALKGIGALIVQKTHKLSPIGYGGGQEEGYRSGTENTPGIFSLGKAVETYPGDAAEDMMARKRQLYNGLKAQIPTLRLNGPEMDSQWCSPHILNVSLVPVRSQTMLFALEGDGIFVSAGSACASHKQRVSQVLVSMGVSHQEADCALRFSLCPGIREEEIERVIERTVYHYQMLKPFVRR